MEEEGVFVLDAWEKKYGGGWELGGVFREVEPSWIPTLNTALLGLGLRLG